ncbi:MAG: hypothetical protein SFV18_12385 [Bryobacteraceae bacterium]|nr:hypothetical protein [Bryobacteraceae bacterium]
MVEQDRVRESARRESRFEKSGQHELIFDQSQSLSSPLQHERAAQVEKARDVIYATLRQGPCHYENLLPIILQTPLFCKTDLNEVLTEEHRRGRIEILGMASRQRMPKEGCLIRLASPAKTA